MSLGIGPATWGADLWAGVIAGGVEEAEETRGLRVTVAGSDVSELVALDSFQVEEELNGRSQASMRFTNDDLTLRLKIGQPVTCKIDGILRFAGTIESIREVVPDTTTTILYEVECVDFNQLADRHYVAARYAVDGQTLYDVVTQILNEDSGDFGETLHDEGVVVNGTGATGSVQTGPVLSPIAFNYQTVTEAFDELSDLVGFWWKIDYNKVLFFVDRATYRAPRDLDEATWSSFGRVSVERGRDQYRNLQILQAGRDISEARTERFKGDGETRSFNLALPVAQKPSVIKVNSSPIASGDIGIRQKDEGKKWYYQVDDKSISQESSETVLGTGDTLEVTYRGYFPIIMIGRADEQIVERQTVEGGTGIYSHVESDGEIDDVGLAEEKVDGLLRRYADLPNRVSYWTMESGFASGQVQTVNLPEYELQGEFLITNVTLSFVGYNDDQDEVYGYNVDAVSGEFLGGWSDFFKRLAKRGRPLSIRENDTVLLIRERVDVISITDTVGTSAALGAYTTDTASTLIVGGYWVGRKNVAANFDLSTLEVMVGPKVGHPEKETLS